MMSMIAGYDMMTEDTGCAGKIDEVQIFAAITDEFSCRWQSVDA